MLPYAAAATTFSASALFVRSVAAILRMDVARVPAQPMSFAWKRMRRACAVPQSCSIPRLHSDDDDDDERKSNISLTDACVGAEFLSPLAVRGEASGFAFTDDDERVVI